MTSILWAEDSAEDRMLIAAACAEAGIPDWQVRFVTDGREALDWLVGNDAPGLVVLDARMPGMDGLATLERIRLLRPGQAVVLMSSMPEPRQARKAQQLGVLDVVHKPLDFGALVQRVRDLAALASRAGAAAPGRANLVPGAPFGASA